MNVAKITANWTGTKHSLQDLQRRICTTRDTVLRDGFLARFVSWHPGADLAVTPD